MLAGKLVLPDSHALPGLPDFTGSLAPGEVCVVVHGHALPRPMGLREGEPFEVLIYGSPGMHPGDLHKVSVCYPEALREMICGTDPTRAHGVFFSTRGGRSLADEIAGGDFDGDEYAVIAWPELVRLFVRPTEPYTPGSMDSGLARQPARGPSAAAPSSAASAAASAVELGSAGGGSVVARPSPGSLTRGAMRQSEQAAQRQVEHRLVANYIMARFMSGSVVGTAGTQWMVCADRLGAASRECMLVRTAAPRLTASRLPGALRSLAVPSSRLAPPTPPRKKNSPPSHPPVHPHPLHTYSRAVTSATAPHQPLMCGPLPCFVRRLTAVCI